MRWATEAIAQTSFSIGIYHVDSNFYVSTLLSTSIKGLIMWLLLLILASDPFTARASPDYEYRTFKACDIVASNPQVIPSITKEGINQPFALVCVKNTGTPDEIQFVIDEANIHVYPRGIPPQQLLDS